jgi:peptide/nickel transport system substrate-binding protein
MRRSLAQFVLAAALAAGACPAFAQSTLRIGLQDDIGTLDPARSSQLVDRMVLRSLCDSLVEVGPDLKLVPMLATAWQVSADGKTWTFKLRHDVKFHDGERFDAQAVKANLDRSRTLPASNRKSELSFVDHVDVLAPDTVAIVLKAPDAALIATLADRAGMMLAPKTLADDAGVAAHPVCAGPYKFVEHVQNDRVVLEKFADYWDAAAYSLQKVVYQPMPDSTVRLANVRSGSIDMLERLAPSDVKAVKGDSSLQLLSVGGLGFNYLIFNVGAHGPAAFKDKRVRQAIELSIDRNAIDQVIGAGLFTPLNQALPPESAYHDAALPMTKRDVQKAKALLKAAGYERINLTMTFGNTTVTSQTAQMLQAMLSEAGITLKLQPLDYPSTLDAGHRGAFEMLYITWSGRVDPDGNLHPFVTCKGALNYGQYCNSQVDSLLDNARAKSALAERKALYDQAQAIVAGEDPIVYLHDQPWPYVLSKKVRGFKPSPDGLIRLRGVDVKG